LPAAEETVEARRLREENEKLKNQLREFVKRLEKLDAPSQDGSLPSTPPKVKVHQLQGEELESAKEILHHIKERFRAPAGDNKEKEPSPQSTPAKSGSPERRASAGEEGDAWETVSTSSSLVTAAVDSTSQSTSSVTSSVIDASALSSSLSTGVTSSLTTENTPSITETKSTDTASVAALESTTSVSLSSTPETSSASQSLTPSSESLVSSQSLPSSSESLAQDHTPITETPSSLTSNPLAEIETPKLRAENKRSVIVYGPAFTDAEDTQIYVADLDPEDWWTVINPDGSENVPPPDSKTAQVECKLDGDDEDSYVFLQDQDLSDAITTFVSLSLKKYPEAKRVGPSELGQLLNGTLSQLKGPTKLGQVVQWGQFLYSAYGWGATLIGVYQDPRMVKFLATLGFKAASWIMVLLI